MADILDVIRVDHQRLQRMQQALRDADRYGSREASSVHAIARVWERLAFLIQMNADAEQEICHLPMSGIRLVALEQLQEAMADLDDVRAAVDEALLQQAGSVAWWRAVRAAISINEQRIGRERGMLADFGRGAGRALRERLADEWLAFTSARITEFVPTARQDGGACQFCRWPLAGRHRHVLDAQHLGIFCSCDVCHDLSRQVKIDPGVIRPGTRRRASGHRRLKTGARRRPQAVGYAYRRGLAPRG